jgi:hypothetical protein
VGLGSALFSRVDVKTQNWKHWGPGALAVDLGFRIGVKIKVMDLR